MSMDANYDTSVDNCKIVIDMATKLYEVFSKGFYLKNHLKSNQKVSKIFK